MKLIQMNFFPLQNRKYADDRRPRNRGRTRDKIPIRMAIPNAATAKIFRRSFTFRTESVNKFRCDGAIAKYEQCLF